MKKIAIAASLAVIPLISAGAGGSAYAQNQEHGHGHHDSAAEIDGLSLNHGERWEMDEHTRTMLIKMEETFLASDHSSQAGLNAAGSELKAQMYQLIAGCTMYGEAHGQLHVFLSGYRPAVDRLAQAGDYAVARQAAIELKGHFETYKQYFR
ncbi:MAG: hypothetical protein RQ867_10535 [Mariprofundaceae bacterium]|nr:hypothetical protein [Mariprofundaceae bacterium]